VVADADGVGRLQQLADNPRQPQRRQRGLLRHP